MLRKITEESVRLQKAKEYAFLLLKYRLRSEKELYQRLKNKNFDEETIKQTLSFLRERGFVNDVYFAKSWIESRLKKSLGFRRLREELKLKGIASAIIDRQIQEAKRDYSEEAIVLRLARERLKRLKGISPEALKRRLYAYLLRRGFSSEMVINVLGKISDLKEVARY